MSETIKAAAIKTGGKVHSLPRPARHADIIAKLAGTGKRDVSNQGFVTSAGRFVGRREAMRIARDAGQVDPAKVRGKIELHSEDVW